MSTEKSARQRAAEAGAQAKLTWPLRYRERRDNYEFQNALTGRARLTARQERQLYRMDRRAAA